MDRLDNPQARRAPEQAAASSISASTDQVLADENHASDASGQLKSIKAKEWPALIASIISRAWRAALGTDGDTSAFGVSSDATLTADQTHWILGILATLAKKPIPPKSRVTAITRSSEAEVPVAGAGAEGLESKVSVSRFIQEAEELGYAVNPIPGDHVADEGQSLPGSRYLVLSSAPFRQPTLTEGLSTDTSAVDDVPHGGQRPFLILGSREGQFLLIHYGDKAPTAVSRQKLLGVLRERLVLRVALTEELPQETPEAFGWKWFTKAFFRRKSVIRDVLIGSLFIQLIALGYPLATQAIVDKVIQNQAKSTLIALGVGVALLALFTAGLSWLRQKFLIRLANLVDAELIGEAFLHLLRLPIRYFETRATGVIVNRLHGIESVREFFSGTFTLVCLELPFSIIFLVLMLTYSWQLSLVSLSFLSVMIGVSFLVGPRLKAHVNQQSLLGAKVQGFLTERIAATETLKSLQLETAVAGRFQELNNTYLGAVRSTREIANGYSTLMNCLDQLMSATVLCVGAYLAMTTSDLTIGMLVAFQMFSQRVSQPLLRLSGAWQQLQQVRVAVSMLGDMLNADPERYSAIATSSAAAKGRLEVQGLGFSYAPERPPLYKDLGFVLEPGQVVLVTGPSGCGKSTLAKILLGLYRDYQGTVRLDGRDTRSMPANEIREFFGVVPQETVLFSGTILENLISAAPHATFEHVVAACKMIGIHEVIENLSEGYQTKVGERGVGLSGGQKQRIGIARALLRRPKVLIFDEATSGLDEVAADQIATTVNQLRARVTVMFIAHRVPATLQIDCHVTIQRERQLKVES